MTRTKIKYFKGQKIGDCEFVRDIPNPLKRERRAIFRCKCGNNFEARIGNVKDGKTKHCGCSHGLITHGHSAFGKTSPECRAWGLMKNRCNNTNDERYSDYGGRGIKVCDRWMESFENFFEDMGPRPSKNHSLDRIGVNRDYCPENCRWATREEQASNKRNNVLIEYKGESKSMSEWAREVGVNYKKLWMRLSKLNWSVDKAFTTP